MQCSVSVLHSKPRRRARALLTWFRRGGIGWRESRTEEIERLKREVSVERLAEARGVKLLRHGADLLGLCPFHDDQEPSLVISPGKNLWHCLGACQSGGSAIDWVMKAEGASFRHAVELLRQGVVSTGPVTAPKFLSKKRHLPSPAALEAEDSELLENVVSYYHATLKESPEPLAYLEKRGLIHPELIDHFRLGYAEPDARLPPAVEGQPGGGGDARETPEAGPLARERPRALQRLAGDPGPRRRRPRRRALRPEDSARPQAAARNPAPSLPARPASRGLQPRNALQASKEVILCEALIDAMSFWCAGFRNVTSSYGIEGFTEEMGEAFEAYGVERVLIAYDRDEAGDKAAEKLAERLQAERDRVLPRALPERHGRQRLRAPGAARGALARPGAAHGAADDRGRRAPSAGERDPRDERRNQRRKSSG